MSKKPQIPLRDMLGAIDRNDLGFYDRLDQDSQKAFSPWLAMRYASSSTREPHHHLLMVNGLVNVDFNTLRGHPGLQWRLLAVCGTGVSQHHPWIPPGRAQKKDRVMQLLDQLYPGSKGADLEVLRDLLTKAQLKELAQSHGMDDKSIKEALK